MGLLLLVAASFPEEAIVPAALLEALVPAARQSFARRLYLAYISPISRLYLAYISPSELRPSESGIQPSTVGFRRPMAWGRAPGGAHHSLACAC